MNRNELYGLLVEYAEGTLDASRRVEVEEILYTRPELQEDLDAIRSAFDNLQHEEEMNVPALYFSNFLPAVRSRIENGSRLRVQFIPSWLQPIIVPAVILIVLLSFAGLYESLKPEHRQSPVYSIVNEIEPSKIDEVTDYLAGFDLSIPGRITHSELLAENFDRTLFADDIIASNTLYENVMYDNQILSQLEENDIEYILEQLKSVQ